MKRLLLVSLALAGGCSPQVGPLRRKPGSNVVLPAHVPAKEVLTKGALCAVIESLDSARVAGKAASKVCDATARGIPAPAK